MTASDSWKCLHWNLGILYVMDKVRNIITCDPCRLSDHINPLEISLLDDMDEIEGLNKAQTLDLLYRR